MSDEKQAASTVVFDLDGTLADCGWRRHLVTGAHRDYAKFHAGIPDDPVNEWCRRLIRSMYTVGHYVVLVSARPKEHEFATRRWLEKHAVPFKALYLLRSDGSTPDAELKTAWAKDFGVESILFVVDDRKKVADAWRALGLVCLHCAEGDY